MKRILFLGVLLLATTILTSCGGVNVTINFDTDGGTEIEPINTDGASSINIPNNPEKEGFVFDGWYWDKGTFLRPFTANSLLDEPISGDLTVYAKWLPESLLTTNFEVIFDAQGGSAVDTQTVLFRDTLTEPDEPTRLGYLFAGWFKDRNHTEEWNFITGKVENNITLYAKWNVISEDYHIVHFVSNFDIEVPSQQVLKGSALTAPNIAREGYTLEGWYTSLNNGDTLDERWSFTTNVVNTNFTLYAKWSINQYTITFNSNGGSAVNPITRDYGTAIDQPQNPFKSGYVFGGWYSDSSLETAFEFDIMPAANMTLYAEWLRTLNFETNGAATINSITFRPGENLIQPNIPTKVGHTFAGWYTNASFSTPFTFGSMPDQNLTLYVKWTINSYTISFEMNGGHPISDLTLDYDQTIAITSEISKTGHTFIGWYTNDSLTSAFTLTKMPAEDLILYAKWEINQYTINFETNGGTPIPPMTEIYDTVLNTPEGPTKEGHTFAGWYEDDEFITPYTFSTVPAFDTVLYAKWTVNTYTLSYITNTDSSIDAELISYGSALPIEHNLTKDGYAFAGWYTDQAFEISLSFDTMPAYDVTLYAKWSRSITFMSNGGSDVESMILDPGVTIIAPNDPTRIGHTFTGWYIDESLTNPFVISVMPDDNLTLYAKWNINQYTISFDSNGGNIVSSITQDFESTVTAPDNPEKEGYSFTGWTSDQEGTTDYIFDIMPASDLTLYAQWQINSYTITFDTGDGTTVDSITQDYQTELTQPANPTRLFYTFDGWYEDQELTIPYTLNLMEARNLTLYSKWLPNEFTITLELNGGTGDTKLTERYTLPIKAPLPEKEGYTFDGWFTDSALTNPYVFSTMPPQNFTLYAKWNINAYTITFETYGGTIYNPIIKIYNTSMPVIEDPIKEGYTFTGWFLDETFEEEYAYSNMPASDITLYARWHNSIIFDSNGGSFVNTITLAAGSTLNKPSNPIKLGHTFIGWYEDMELTIPYVFSTMLEPNITVYAKWEVNQYIIGFEPNGGDYVETSTQDFGTELILPTPVRTGYSFIGWYKDAELTQTLDFTTVQASNMVLYAKWEINQYTITFEPNGGNSVEEITQDYDTEFELPETTKEGYTFVGWYIDDSMTQVVDFSKIPANDMVLYAKWEINQYQMAFNTDGGTLINPIIQDYNSEITEPQDPTKEGHTFIGWYADQSLTEEYTFSLMPSYDVTIYAKWSVNSYTISFNTSGGTEISPIFQDFGTYINYPTIPQKADKVFIGWFGDVDLINEFYIQNMHSENITLYAKWGDYSPLYNVYSDHAEVIGFDIDEGYVETIDLIIPSTYNGVPITVITAGSFANQTQLSSITIPNSVTTIQNGSFSGISNLTLLSIPFVGTNRTVTTANFYELFGSFVGSIPSSLTHVKITDQEKIPNYAFKTIYTITHYELPSNLKRIGIQAFAQRLYSTNPARYFIFPDTLEYIGDSAFTGSNFAEPLVFSESMSYIGMNAFWSASNVQIFAPSPNLYIGIWAFKEASNVKLYVSVSTDSSWPGQWDEYAYSLVVTWNHIFTD